MNTFRRSIQRHNSRRGVALIITLGMLAVLTLLAIAFAIAMRVENMAARNYANLIRSKHLVRNGLTMTIDDINNACRESTYPSWQDAPPPGFSWDPRCISVEALGSYDPGASADDEVDLLQGEATAAIPPILRADAEAVQTFWKDVIVTNRHPSDGSPIVQTNGSIAYLIVNCSGLLDANYIGGSPRDLSIDPTELDITAEIPNDTLFFNDRNDHVRYETVQELYAINSAVDPYVSSNLFIHSLDVGKESYFENTNQLGYINCVLIPKFNINSITNWAVSFVEAPPGNPPNMTALWTSTSPSNGTFQAGYFEPLTQLLLDNIYELNPAQTRSRDVAWNIINYLDEDRIPECDGTYPWRNTEASEPIPLINEICLEPDTSGTNYQFKVELWYPFSPRKLTASEDFRIQIGVYSQNWTGTGAAPNEWNILDKDYLLANHPDHLIMVHEEPIGDMEFGNPANEYKVFETPLFWLQGGAISSTNPVWFLCRVVQNVGASKPIPVDESMGYQQSEENRGNANDLTRRALKKFDSAPIGYMINDPRVNGQCRYWDPTLNAATADNMGFKYGPGTPRASYIAWNTLERFNDRCAEAWSGYKSQGVPIYAPTNALMQNISELGHIFRSNLDDEFPNEVDSIFRLWRTIDLMNNKEGAALMDFVSVTGTNTARRGLVTINSRQNNALHTLFHGLNIANPGDVNPPPPAAAIDSLVNEIIYKGPYMHWRDMFDAGLVPADPRSPGSDGGPVAVAMRNLCDHIGLVQTNDIMNEAAARGIVELISFRQNIFVVVVAARAYGRNGHTPVGEQRAIATIIRDSYTGRHFIRSFKWLTD